MIKTKNLCFIPLIGFFICWCSTFAQAQYSYQQEPLLSLIKKVEEQTPYRFLYRNSLVSNITVNISEDESNFFTKLEALIKPYYLGLNIDEKRNRVVIYQLKEENITSNNVSITGQVLDATSGERLPFAIITWQQNNVLKGLSTNESGAFSIQQNFNTSSIELTCSYTGYKAQQITLALENISNFDDLTCRLEPDRIDVNQLIVIGSSAYSDVNQHSASIVDIGTFSPMGETSTISALQSLPAVSLSPMLSSGLQVRGSPSDGFRVLIDDITVYNQSHLFGLIDSFNGDVLQRGGFYYDIAPAKIQAPPGGTLSLVTKTGSLDKISGTAGLSNSSVRLTLDGPIQKGKSSWLISGRRSYMNTIDWFNNSKLTQWGLNVGRPKSELAAGLSDLESYLVRNGKTDATFFDLHGKVYFESKSGNRLILSGYLGGDDTQYSAERLFRQLGNNNSSQFAFRPVSTDNDWRNGALSAKFTQWLSNYVYSSSVAGMSIYKTTFKQKDFMYIKSSGPYSSLNAFIFPFQNQSVLNDISFQQSLEINKIENWFWSTGFTYNYYLGEYAESSFDRPGYFGSTESQKIDLFAQTDFTGWDDLSVFMGARAHYYSNGEYFRVSPRLKFKFFPNSLFSFGGGFSKNHQFINQISLSNTTSTDVWILADENQKPTSVNYYSLGLYINTGKLFYAQLEGYIKDFDNLRLHEINTFSLSNTYSTNPWFSDNTGRAKGIEFLTKSDFNTFQLSQTFAISEVMLSNPLINNGNSFYADWDRKFRYTTILSIRPTKPLSAFIAWNFATGAPDKIATFGAHNNERLDNYTRTDVTVEYKRDFTDYDISISASIFNLFDTQSSWYRDLSITLDQNRTPNQITGTPVDVYDIGFQPSFNIRVGF